MTQSADNPKSAPTAERPDKRILLSLADGPESIEIYESEEQAVVDWAAQIPALYINASIGGATACFSCQSRGAGWANGPERKYDWITGKVIADTEDDE